MSQPYRKGGKGKGTQKEETEQKKPFLFLSAIIHNLRKAYFAFLSLSLSVFLLQRSFVSVSLYIPAMNNP